MRLLSLLAAGSATAIPLRTAFPQSPLMPTMGSSQDRPEDVINASPLLSFHREIVEIDSVTGNEHDVGDYIVQYLENQSFTVVKQELPSESNNTKPRFNIYAYPANNPTPEILLTSHIDTVPPFIPYSLSQPTSASPADILISGRGSVDAKGSVATQLFAALQTLQDSPRAPLGLLFVVGEETGGDGMKHFSSSPLNSPSFHTVIFGEPTELALAQGHKGILGFEVVASGKAAHSGYPWLGKSAISAILPALSRLDHLPNIPPAKGGLPSDPKYGETTLNIGTLTAGVATNVVPAAARADVAVRLAAGTPEHARDLAIRAVRDATGGDRDVHLDFSKHIESYAPQDLDADVDGFELTVVNYGTDVPNLRTREGVKRYLYGPGSIHVAHGEDEGVTVGQMEDAVVGYSRLIEVALERSQ